LNVNVQGRDVKVVDVLADASAALDSEFDGVPEAEAAVRNMLGAAFDALELNDEAEAEYLRARHLFEQEAPDDPEYLKTLKGLANLFADTGRLEESLTLARLHLDRTLALYGGRSEQAYAARSFIVYPLWELGRIAEAIALLEADVELCREDLGDTHPEYQSYLNNLGVLYSSTGRWEQGIVISREAHRIAVEINGENHVTTLGTLLNLALAIKGKGELTGDDRRECLRVAQYVFEARTRILGEDSSPALWVMGDVCDMLVLNGRFDEAVELRAAQLRGIEESGKSDQRVYFHSLGRATEAVLALERYDEAEDFARRSLAGFRAIHAEDSRYVLMARHLFARVALAQGDAAAAFDVVDALIEPVAMAFFEGSPQPGRVAETRGLCLADLGRVDEARAQLEAVLASYRETYGGADERVERVQAELESLNAQR